MIAALALPACVLPAGGDGEPGPWLSRGQITQTADRDGRLSVTIDVPKDAVSLQLTGDAADALVSFDQLVDPDGNVVFDWQDWWDAEEKLTQSMVPQRTTAALDWPVRAEDAPLRAGTWTAWLSMYDPRTGDPAGDVDVDLYSDLKMDDTELDRGAISVRFVWARGVRDEPGVYEAMDAAVRGWAEIWGGRDVELAIEEVESDLDPNLGFAWGGDPDVVSAIGDKKDGQLVLIVGDTVDGEDGLYGFSAGIPGTVEATSNTYVVLSWITHAGRDGAFDDEEIRIMSETMAHETGHYTGLFHPVESDVSSWDALDDTVRCTRIGECESELGHNLMFPYPVCTAGGCGVQDEITNDQSGVMHQYVGAL